MPIEIGNPFGDQTLTLFGGFELDRMGALIALSMAFLGYVIINGMFKLYINTYKGRSWLSGCCVAFATSSSTVFCAFRIRNTAGCEAPKSQP